MSTGRVMGMAKKQLTQDCPKCGFESSARSYFCERCGHTLRSLSLYSGQWKPESISELVRIIRDRTRTDRLISPAYVVTVLSGSIAASFLSAAVGQFTGQSAVAVYYSSLTAFVVLLILFAKVVYDAINRQNAHFQRERKLREAISSLMKSAKGMLSQTTEVDKYVPDLTNFVTPPQNTEKTRSPLWWAFVDLAPYALTFAWLFSVVAFDALGIRERTELFVIAILALFVAVFVFSILEIYMMMFLMTETWGHDARWEIFVERTRTAMARLGYPSGTIRVASHLPQRSFPLYFVLSILTGGFFVFYWWYTLIKDPNDHFRRQWEVEDQLMELVGANRGVE